MNRDNEKISILKYQLEDMLLKSSLARKSPYEMFKDEILDIKNQVEIIFNTRIHMEPTETPQRLEQQRMATFLFGLGDLKTILGIT